ncbi:hypothetical protein [Parafrankia discariae]|uniref:hypothetical protein n=1 Tax=Parafrankia discariae TaxID=365528 RepID=UPI00037738AC|nr:hypothetical protein [Parafrankia discariae]
MTREAWDDEHLAHMFFADRSESAGYYLPGGFDLRLARGDTAIDRLVHVHEAQHAILNDETAWGAAMHFAIRVPPWRRSVLRSLVDACGTPHECFATFMSTDIVRIRHPDVVDALPPFPAYRHYRDTAAGVVAETGGPHRRALALTALALVCMQTPVLDRLINAWPDGDVDLALLRQIDIPEGRWARVLRDESRFGLGSLAKAADRAVTDRFGPDALAADGEDRPGSPLDFDAEWALWERTVFDGLADRLRDAGATVVPPNDHLEQVAELTALVRSRDTGFDLAAMPPGSSGVNDAVMLAAISRQGRHWVAGGPRPARLLAIGTDVEVDEVVRVVDATCRIAGTPTLVVSCRLPRRVHDGYDLGDSDRERLNAHGAGPTVWIRSVADDGSGEERDTVWHIRLPSPTVLQRLVEQWGGRGPVISSITSSCLLDESWRARWLPALSRIGALTILLDTGLDTFARGWSAPGAVLHGLYLDLPGPEATWRGLALALAGEPTVWLAVADDLGVELLTSQLAAMRDVDLRMTGADWSAAVGPLQVVLIHLLATEAFFDLAALADARPPTRRRQSPRDHV